VPCPAAPGLSTVPRTTTRTPLVLHMHAHLSFFLSKAPGTPNDDAYTEGRMPNANAPSPASLARSFAPSVSSAVAPSANELVTGKSSACVCVRSATSKFLCCARCCTLAYTDGGAGTVRAEQMLIDGRISSSVLRGDIQEKSSPRRVSSSERSGRPARAAEEEDLCAGRFTSFFTLNLP
jgi:hypothetical protein